MRKNIRILFRGLWRTICGTALAASMGVAGYSYAQIPTVDGYQAVVDFLLASIVMVLGLYLMWCMGGGRKRISGSKRGV